MNGARGAMVGAEASAGGRAEASAGGVPAGGGAGVLPNGLFFLFAKNAFGTGWYFQPVPMDV